MLTPSEFKKRIAESEHADWFNEQEVEFHFSRINQEVKLSGISSIYEYLSKEVNSWGKIEKELPEELKKSYSFFNSMYSSIEHLVSVLINDSLNSIISHWRQIEKQKLNINQFGIPFNSSEAQFLIKIQKEFSKGFHGAYNYIINQDQPHLQKKHDFIGALLAYEYFNKDSEIVKRENDEKESLSSLKNEFQKYINKTEQDVVSVLKNTKEKYDEHIKYIETLKNDKEAELEKLINKINVGYFNFDKESKLRLEELENIYEKKLMLEKPAKYWDKKSKTFYNQAITTRKILMWVIGVSSAVLIAILFIAPDWIFEKVFEGNTVAIVRWSIVFITLISLIAYIVRALTKFMFSSFHLARDAEERHTLTYFYLALLKDASVTDKDKELIMQSLFSRTETGLLKDDASPTMPNDIISKFMSK